MTLGDREWLDLVNQEGMLERPFQASSWWVPGRLSLEDHYLAWKWLPAGGWPRSVRSGPKLLEGFFGLVDCKPEQILAYAQKWGTLNLCRHGLPNLANAHNPCRPLTRDGWVLEPLKAWSEYAAKFRALARLAISLHAGDLGRESDWQAVYPKGYCGRSAPWWRRTVSGERAFFSLTFQELIVSSGIRLTYYWVRDSPELRLASNGLFRSLVLQLATVTARTSGWAICSGCSGSFIPARRPPVDRRTYCASCRRHQIPQRDAARDYRARKRPDSREK
jgi:hypothetical protein